MASSNESKLPKPNIADSNNEDGQQPQSFKDAVFPNVDFESLPGLFGLPGYIPDDAPVDFLRDFYEGKVDDIPKTRRPFGNSVNMAMNAIDVDDNVLDHFFMLENPSDPVRNGAKAALIYMLSELHAKDVTICGLVGGCVARFAQSIPELEHMIDTTEMDRHALLDPSNGKLGF